MTTKTTKRGLVALLLGSSALLGHGAPARAKGPAGGFVQLPAADLKFEEFYPGGPTESFIIGSKEAKHGPTAFFIKFKGGFDSGWHIHESEYTGVVLTG